MRSSLRTGPRLASVLLLALCACQEETPPPQWYPSAPPPLATPVAVAMDIPVVVATTAVPEADSASTQEEPSALSRTFSRLRGSPRPAWFLCDGTNRPRIAVVERDEGGSTATLTWVDKSKSTAPTHQTYALGEVSAGAGQRFFPLLQGDKEIGNLHAVNPGMLPDPSQALIPTFVSLKERELDLNCRWMLGVRVLGFDRKRSVLISQKNNALLYQSFDFANAAKARQLKVEGYGHTTKASQTVQGGTEEHTSDGSIFTFKNGPYTYVLRAGTEASLEVLRDGRRVQRTDLLAWTYAPPSP